MANEQQMIESEVLELTDAEWEEPLENIVPVCLITDPDCEVCT